MFRKPEDEWVFGAEDIRKIRSFGDSAAGKALGKFIEREVEGAIEGMMRGADATNPANVAYVQGQRNLGHAVWSLLNIDVDQLLASYNLEEKDEASD